MQQMALIKGFTESRSASRKRLKHDQGMAWIRIDFDCLDPDQDSGEQKLLIKIEKKCNVLKCWMFSLRGEGLSCSLDVLYGGLGIMKLQFLFYKIQIFIS
jgi:hypothetical protein